MIYKEFTTVSDVINNIPDKHKNRFSPGGWEIWWNKVSSECENDHIEFDIYMVTDYYEYDSPEDAINDLWSEGTLDAVRRHAEETGESVEDVCLELLTEDKPWGDYSPRYYVSFAKGTPNGGVLALVP